MKTRGTIARVALFLLSIACIILLIHVVKLSSALDELQEEYINITREIKEDFIENGSEIPFDEDVKETENEKSQEKVWTPMRDASYKMFFGEWEIVDIIPGRNPHLEVQEDLSAFLGTRLFYDVKDFKINGEEISNNIYYEVAIVPVENIDLYFNNRRTVFKDINDIISLDQDCFIHINVTYEDCLFQPVGNSFYIKDQDTIILEILFNDCFYYLKCKRIAYLEDYEYIVGPL